MEVAIREVASYVYMNQVDSLYSLMIGTTRSGSLAT